MSSELSDGVIYWVRCSCDPRIYIGSTRPTRPKARLGEHVSSARDPDELRTFYQAIRKYGAENFTLEIVEARPDDSAGELEIREFQWIEATPAALLFNDELELHKVSETSRQKIRDAWTDERRKALSQRLREFWTDEEKARFSIAHSGVNHPNFRGGSVYDLVGERSYVVEWRENGKIRKKRFGYVRIRTKEEAKRLADQFKANIVHPSAQPLPTMRTKITISFS